MKKKKTSKTKTRNAFAIVASRKKSGKILSKKDKARQRKNKRKIILLENS